MGAPFFYDTIFVFDDISVSKKLRWNFSESYLKFREGKGWNPSFSLQKRTSLQHQVKK